MAQNTETDLVRYSRAGDVFHYRWAARRCLKMLNPKSNLRSVVIEGSEERKAAGEYVIDVTEYLAIPESKISRVTYYQLKHSTTRVNEPFKISDLKGTIEGFAKRFNNIASGQLAKSIDSARFVILTNRVIDDKFKDAITLLKNGQDTPTRIKNTLIKYTGLKGGDLKQFCTQLELCDKEGDYVAQRHALHVEMSGLLADTVEIAQIESIIGLVASKALPDSDGKIVKEEILKRFGVTSPQELFPAPEKLEALPNPVKREQHADILAKVLNHQLPTIIKAGGGVGKSIFTQQLAASLPSGSLAITYDCFGAGTYRNRSTTRHKHRHALVQIINEIASHGLCSPLIPNSSYQDDQLMRSFISRLKQASEQVIKVSNDAVLAIFIDAADNAEMAASEFSESCFAHQLLREEIPVGCRIIELCRPERIHLLKPKSTVQQIVLEPFSEQETALHLLSHFQQSNDKDCLEFHRLTAGNPRVQINAMGKTLQTVAEVLGKLGPGATVDEQIEAQLADAINRLKDNLPETSGDSIDAICMGLANLPPFIPIEVLAATTSVTAEAIISFISDLGSPLLLTDDAVQFRDEPTETWFRKQFSASSKQIASFVERLKPLAGDHPYISETLPSLLLAAEQYDELIQLALSDKHLPEHSPIDARNIRVYRLQFAFKAAIKQQQFNDATKIALSAGEEVAGNDRQLTLLKDNIDLIAPLQSPMRIQELAYRRLIKGDWDGSENVYSASLLSTVEDFKGEARGYLRSSKSWLKLHFEEKKKSKRNRPQNKVNSEDIVELAFTNFNLYGAQSVVAYLLGWQRPEAAFNAIRQLIKRLIDSANFQAIADIATAACQSQYLMLGITSELFAVGHCPPVKAIESCLELFIGEECDTTWNDKRYVDPLICFAESCAKLNLCGKKILRFCERYFVTSATEYLADSICDGERECFLRSITLLAFLRSETTPTIEQLVSQIFKKNKKGSEHHRNLSSFKEVIGALLPWYTLRVEVICDKIDSFGSRVSTTKNQSGHAIENRYIEHDLLSCQINEVKFEILSLATFLSAEEVGRYMGEELSDSQFYNRLTALRSAHRLPHLSSCTETLEHRCYEQLQSSRESRPEAKAEGYILLARAILPASHEDAAAYFDLAIEAVSKFGDEIMERWQAVVALAKRSNHSSQKTPELAYRFIRCAEMLGDYVDDDNHWERGKAVEVCAILCPKSAISALSRWRERDIGWFDRQLPILANKLLCSTVLSPAALWSLTSFEWERGETDFAIDCIKCSPSIVAQSILDMAVKKFRLRKSPEYSLKKLAEIAADKGLVNSTLDDVIGFYTINSAKEVGPTEHQPDIPAFSKKTPVRDWNKLLDGIPFETSEGSSRAAIIFNDLPAPRSPDEFWQEVCKRVPTQKAVEFLNSISSAESSHLYDIREVMAQFPRNWLKKIRVKNAWPTVFDKIGCKHAIALTEHWQRKYFLKECDFYPDAETMLHKGMLKGLAKSDDLASATMFWGFIEFATESLTSDEATELLDFALTRFELHIDDEHADGPWADWLIAPDNLVDTLSGFIWSALGSPRATIRWQAAHCVRALAATGCQPELDSLIGWMNKETVDSFGSNKYSFYNLHARQYLLIALARIAIDHSGILKKHSALFEQMALHQSEHLLIQKYAAETALSIEAGYPGSYSDNTIECLRSLGISKLPVIDLNSSDYQAQTSWNSAKGSNDQSAFSFNYDFQKNWLKPLGRVFDIHVDEIENLASNVILKDWKINSAGGHIKDPRTAIWRQGSSGSETYYRYTAPKTDGYQFYLSYHAMLSVAATLVKTTPCVRRYIDQDNSWMDWVKDYTLTREDGRWLADRRDPAPLLRRPWVDEKSDTNRFLPSDQWRWQISATDFLETLLLDGKDDTPWINLWGSWNELSSNQEETFLINSALVSPDAANALLLALQTMNDPHDYKLPNFGKDEDDDEGDFEFNTPPFNLTGWIVTNQISSHLDQFDSAAADVQFPPLGIAESIAKSLSLTPDSEKRFWYANGQELPAIKSEIWSSKNIQSRDDLAPMGRRISASVTILKQLCSVLACEIIFEVQLKRNYSSNSYQRDENDVGYCPANSKVFILSADGKLRDYRETYQIGEADT